MRDDGPHIEVVHSGRAVTPANPKSLVIIDGGPLCIHTACPIGSKDWEGIEIKTPRDQVLEYPIWLEDQIKLQNPVVLDALERIYELAITVGAILWTQEAPQPHITAATAIRRAILQLAP